LGLPPAGQRTPTDYYAIFGLPHHFASLRDVMTLRAAREVLYSGHEGQMEVDFDDERLDRLETDRGYDAGFGREVVKGFRKLMQIIRAAPDERDFYALKGLHFEKLEGDRSHERSMKINKQWRLIVEMRGSNPNKRVLVKSIEDYH
jgi:toxin HigB-1